MTFFKSCFVSFICKITVDPLSSPKLPFHNPKVIHSLIQCLSGHFYSASSNPLLLRGASDTAWILCRKFTLKSATFNCELRTCPSSLYMAARAGVEPMTLRTKGVDSTNVLHMPRTQIPLEDLTFWWLERVWNP